MSEQQKRDEKRTPYRIEVEPEKFPAVDEGAVISSTEFCDKFSQIMRETFCNYKGSTFEVGNNGAELIMYFTHVDELPVSNDGRVLHLGTERDGATKVGQSVLDKTRFRDNLMMNGDCFRLTEDGKDVVLPLLAGRYYNGGKPNWKQLTSEYVKRDPYGVSMPSYYTKVRGIDPVKAAALIWGRKDDSGKYVDYGITRISNMSMQHMYGTNNIPGNNYMIHFVKIHKDQLTNTYRSLGFGVIDSDII